MLQTNSRNFVQTVLRTGIGVFGLPLILLYTIAYRLVGVPTTYQWGDIDVKPIVPVSQGQFLFSRLFPLLVATLAFIITWAVGS